MSLQKYRTQKRNDNTDAINMRREGERQNQNWKKKKTVASILIVGCALVVGGPHTGVAVCAITGPIMASI